MAKGIRYSDEFKQEAVNPVAIHGYSVADVADRFKSLYDWMKTFLSRLNNDAKNRIYRQKSLG